METPNNKTHKAGFVSILGRPNVGKSTLMNLLVGEKLAIITSKAQTTRHRIQGIVNGDSYQIVYSDTPGILEPHYKLHEAMMKEVHNSLTDADIFIFITDIYEEIPEENELFNRINKSEAPLFVLVNKIDQLPREGNAIQELTEKWQSFFPKGQIIPISALQNINIDVVQQKILDHLPVSPPYYPKDALTDKPERFFVAEMIREKILYNYKQEIPYSVEVKVEEFKEEDKIIRIRAVIYTAKDSQKGILIGNKGESLKKTGMDARKDLENFFDKQVYLSLHVKVMKNWRNQDKTLKFFGYSNK